MSQVTGRDDPPAVDPPAPPDTPDTPTAPDTPISPAPPDTPDAPDAPTAPAPSDTPDRFSRQRLIPGWEQDRLGAATAVVIGVGALGNEVAKNLALAGVGRLILVDPDVVAEGNLSRTVLFGPGDPGRSKVVAAAGALRDLVPGLAVEARDADLAAGAGLGELADAAVVLGCLDSRRARMRLLGRCALVGAPLVDGGTHPWGGELRLRLHPDEACHACSLRPHERGETDLPWSCADPVDDGPAPASIVSTSIVAGWMTLVAVRILLGDPPPFRMLRIEGVTGRTEPVAVTRDPTCPYHRPLTGPVVSVPVGHTATVGELLAALPADAEPTGWNPFPLPGSCRHCVDRYDRIESTGGAIACRRCGRPIRPRLSERLRDAAPGRSLRSLGVAPGEILPVRFAEGGYRWYRMNG